MTRQTMKENKYGYACGCGAYHPADEWVVAHWHAIMLHTCKVCQVTNTIKRGVILRTSKAKPSTQEARS